MDGKDASLSESDEEDVEEEERDKLRESDKFALIFEKWAKYMLRLDDYRPLKDFLNVISGFDLVSAKSEYFVDGNNAMDMLTDVMGLMGEFDGENQDEMKTEDDSGLGIGKVWNNLNSFDLS